MKLKYLFITFFYVIFIIIFFIYSYVKIFGSICKNNRTICRVVVLRGKPGKVREFEKILGLSNLYANFEEKPSSIPLYVGIV